MKKIITDSLNTIRKNSKSPYSESIWNQLQTDGHKFDLDIHTETLRAMQHVGLIENRLYKGEESSYAIGGNITVSAKDDLIHKEGESISKIIGNMVESDWGKNC